MSGRALNFVFELFGGLPRQGSGSSESTRRALSLLPPLGVGPRVLDIGCGSGAQSIELARCSGVEIVVVDLHPPFVARLNAQVAELGLGSRLRAQVGDMARLEFPPESFDAIWCEGAIYNIGSAGAGGLATVRWSRRSRSSSRATSAMLPRRGWRGRRSGKSTCSGVNSEWYAYVFFVMRKPAAWARLGCVSGRWICKRAASACEPPTARCVSNGR